MLLSPSRLSSDSHICSLSRHLPHRLVLAESAPLLRVPCISAYLMIKRELECQLGIEATMAIGLSACVIHDERFSELIRCACKKATPSQQQAFELLSDCFDSGVEGTFMTNCVQVPGKPMHQAACSDGDFAVYGTYSLINHSCECNAQLRHRPDGKLFVVALRDIFAGEEITDNYVSELGDDIAQRGLIRRRLRERWRFDCACERCTRDAIETPDALPTAPAAIGMSELAKNDVLMGVNSWDYLLPTASQRSTVEISDIDTSAEATKMMLVGINSWDATNFLDIMNANKDLDALRSGSLE